MAPQDFDRRAFLRNSARAGMTMCGLCVCSQLPSLGFAGEDENAAPAGGEQQALDPKRLCYCGHQCAPDCKLRKGTLENNDELKKEAFEAWKLGERYGIEFDPEQIICYGCKVEDKPVGIVLQACTVRSCAKEKKLDCCIECSELKGCDKDLWRRYPDFKAHMLKMQEQYQAQG